MTTKVTKKKVTNWPILVKQEGDSAFGIEVPDLPGCFSAADSMEEVHDMAREAIKGHIAILSEMGEDIPMPKNPTKYFNMPEYSKHLWGLVTIEEEEAHQIPIKEINTYCEELPRIKTMGVSVFSRMESCLRRISNKDGFFDLTPTGCILVFRNNNYGTPNGPVVPENKLYIPVSGVKISWMSCPVKVIKTDGYIDGIVINLHFIFDSTHKRIAVMLDPASLSYLDTHYRDVDGYIEIMAERKVDENN